MTLDVEYQPISAGTLRLRVTMMESFRNLRELGNCYTYSVAVTSVSFVCVMLMLRLLSVCVQRNVEVY